MPNRDGMGPMSQGPRIGRGMGLGKELGIGCRRFRFFANATSLSKDDLVIRKQMLEQELDAIDRALNRTAENQ